MVYIYTLNFGKLWCSQLKLYFLSVFDVACAALLLYVVYMIPSFVPTFLIFELNIVKFGISQFRNFRPL